MSKTIGMSFVVGLCCAPFVIASDADLSSSGAYSEEALRKGQAAMQASMDEALEQASQARAFQLQAIEGVIERQGVGQAATQAYLDEILESGEAAKVMQLEAMEEAIEVQRRGQAMMQRDWDETIEITLGGQTALLKDFEDIMEPLMQTKAIERATVEEAIVQESTANTSQVGLVKAAIESTLENRRANQELLIEAVESMSDEEFQVAQILFACRYPSHRPEIMAKLTDKQREYVLTVETERRETDEALRASYTLLGRDHYNSLQREKSDNEQVELDNE